MSTDNQVNVYASSDPVVSIQESTEVTIERIASGPQGAPGPGVVISGTTGQVLAKNSNTNFDTTWKTLNFAELADVNVSSKADKSLVFYDMVSQKFVANSSLTTSLLTDGGNF